MKVNPYYQRQKGSSRYILAIYKSCINLQGDVTHNLNFEVTGGHDILEHQISRKWYTVKL